MLFARAHIMKRRPTIIAKEMPKLTDHQVQVLTDRWDIHGGAADHPEGGNSYGGPINQEEHDTSLPPAEPTEKAGMNTVGRTGSGSSVSGDNTRVPTPTA